MSEHGGQVPRSARAVRGPFVAALGLLLLLTLLHAAGLALFTSGFLLQRVELTEQTTCTRPGNALWSVPAPPAGAADGDSEALRAWDALLEEHAECTLPPRFKRAVVWIVDALRYDFLADALPGNGSTPNVYMHNLLRTPAERTRHVPRGSFLAHFVADPPTTTLQRLKGLTTGSLPTFIEAGANFGGAGRVREDTWIGQLRERALAARGNATGGMTFVGDDTWQMVFASLFDEAWPYSSFNVEDLDTVDAGVEQRMLHAMEQPDWTLIVAHSLGVDHVGHRFGPAHARMPPKLQQMDELVQKVLDRLDDETLFVFLGDHGMDATGDHGGDSELEIGSALWMHATRPFDPDGTHSTQPLSDDADVDALLRADTPVPAFQSFTPLPVAPDARGHRSLPQIDLVPTLSLLLGVPIPFNNLGTVLPEAFTSDTTPLGQHSARLLRALRINARQVHTYLEAYAVRSADLTPFQTELHDLWVAALKADAHAASLEYTRKAAAAARTDAARAASEAYLRFLRVALHRARSVWAQFDTRRIAVGFALFLAAMASTALLWRHVMAEPLQVLAQRVLLAAGKAAAASAGLALVAELVRVGASLGASMSLLGVAGAYLLLAHWTPTTTEARGTQRLLSALVLVPAALLTALGPKGYEGVLAAAAGGATLAVLWNATPRSVGASRLSSPSLGTWSAAFLLAMHAVLFASNSFTMWEDRITLFLLTVVLAVRAVRGAGVSLVMLQQRMPFLALGALLLVRLAAMSRVCREEQMPYCAPSFFARHVSTEFADNPAYALSGPATNSVYAIVAAYVVAFAMSDVLRRQLMPSKAHLGVAATILQWIVRPALLGGAAFWLADWAHGLDTVDESTRAWLMTVKVWVARAVLALTFGGAVFWYFAPLSLSVMREPSPDGGRPRVMILGFSNSLGSAMLMITTVLYTWLFLLAQPMGQLALSACLVAAVFLAELGDNERDARLIAESRVLEGVSVADAARSVRVTPPDQGPTLLETTSIALLGFVTFFATGHQTTLSTIQWRVAFVGFPTVTYPWSPLFVVLNAFGPFVVFPAFAAVLLTVWNVAPERAMPEKPRPAAMRLPRAVLRTALAFALYHGVIALSAAAWAYFFRRHLMLFKIWVPRFMTAVLGLLLADISLMAAVACVWGIATKVHRVFATSFA